MAPGPRVLSTAEAVATGAAGAALGWIAARPFGFEAAAAAVGGANGVLGGARGVYDWKDVRGWVGFVLDSTWGLAGTAGALAVHAANAAARGGYIEALSRRRGYHVYGGGVRLRRGFTTTIGNVMTSASGGGGREALDASTERGRRRIRLVDRHEALHVWQSRSFGPLFPIAYGAWMVGGALAGTAVWAVRRGPGWFSLVETAAYYDNPFEYWAYRRDGNWPPKGANPALVWPPRRH